MPEARAYVAAAGVPAPGQGRMRAPIWQINSDAKEKMGQTKHVEWVWIPSAGTWSSSMKIKRSKLRSSSFKGELQLEIMGHINHRGASGKIQK